MSYDPAIPLCYRAAVFSTEEEKQVEGKGPLGGFVRFYPEDVLRKAGFRIEPANPWTSHVVRDRELITGQNPQSEKLFTQTLIVALEETRSTRLLLQGFESRAREMKERKIGLSDYSGLPHVIENGVGYRVLGKGLDWRQGYSTFFLGRRKTSVRSKEFHRLLSRHITDVSREFASRGLRGYVVIATPDFEIAIQNWDRPESMTAAFASEAGKAIAEDAGNLLSFERFGPAKDYPGAWEFATLPVRRK